MYNLGGRRAVVTGGTGGIGTAVARQLAASGATVVITDIDGDACTAIAAELSATGLKVEGVGMDVTNRAQVDRFFDEQVDQGGVDILVTSAAIATSAPILDYPVETWEKVLAVNLTGTFHCCQCAGRQMVEKGFGRIITMSSVNGQVANAHRGAYSCTKGGVDMLTKLLAAELGGQGVTANAVAPSPVDTPMILDIHGPKDRQLWYDQMPIKRYAKPEEVAEAVCFLASDNAAFINGHILNVDGGFMASGILLD